MSVARWLSVPGRTRLSLVCWPIRLPTTASADDRDEPDGDDHEVVARAGAPQRVERRVTAAAPDPVVRPSSPPLPSAPSPDPAGGPRRPDGSGALPKEPNAGPPRGATSNRGRRRGRLAGRRLGELRGLLGGADAHDVPGQPERSRAGSRGRGVDLPAPHAVGGGRRERVVVVVPGLAERQQGEPEEVARLVAGVEAAAAEEVAQRVDRVGQWCRTSMRTRPPQSSPVRPATNARR